MDGLYTFVELCLGVFDDVACDAGLIGTFFDLVSEGVEEAVHVDVSALAELDRFVGLAGEEAEERDVVLPVVACGPEVSYASLDVYNLLEKWCVLVTVDAVAIVQC